MNDVVTNTNASDTLETLRSLSADQAKAIAERITAERKAEWERHRQELADKRAVRMPEAFAGTVLSGEASDTIYNLARRILMKAFEDAGISIVSMGRELTNPEKGTYKATNVRVRSVAYSRQKTMDLKGKEVTVKSTDDSATFSRVVFADLDLEIGPNPQANDGSLMMYVRNNGPSDRALMIELNKKDWPTVSRDQLKYIVGDGISNYSIG